MIRAVWYADGGGGAPRGRAPPISSFTGGQNDLHFGVDMGVTALFSLAIYYFALSRRLPADMVRERLQSGADEVENLEGTGAT